MCLFFLLVSNYVIVTMMQEQQGTHANLKGKRTPKQTCLSFFDGLSTCFGMPVVTSQNIQAQ